MDQGSKEGISMGSQSSFTLPLVISYDMYSKSHKHPVCCSIQYKGITRLSKLQNTSHLGSLYGDGVKI